MTRNRTWAGYLLGFALGGFFDGILLHQILQWHHLLLGIQRGALQRIETQILADGLFHALMYVIALAGLVALWRARQRTPDYGSRLVLADALVGFGVWHVLDAVLSHWILGIHRIKMDSPNPLLWDLLWFFVFGIAPLVVGLIVKRAPPGSTGAGTRVAHGTLSAAVLILGPVAALPPRDIQQVAVLVRADDVSQLLDGLQQMGGGILWVDRRAALWVLHLPDAGSRARLYEHGALLVTRSPAVLGCLTWTRMAKPATSIPRRT